MGHWPHHQRSAVSGGGHASKPTSGRCLSACGKKGPKKRHDVVETGPLYMYLSLSLSLSVCDIINYMTFVVVQAFCHIRAAFAGF